MALENAEVLKNLEEQRDKMATELENGRQTYLKILGAIDVLTQIQESGEEGESGDDSAAPTEVVEGE